MTVYDHRFVASFFASRSLDRTALDYIHFHQLRFAFILNQIVDLRKKSQISRVLDIGPSYLTNLVSSTFQDLHIETLGLSNHLVDKERYHRHYIQDLNFISETDQIPVGNYDLVIFAEVVEHLYTDPNLVLKSIYKMIRPGGFLLLQTPNAVSIDKRIKMMWGKNPYQFILPGRQNHFREYTRRELINYLENCGYQIDDSIYSNYFNPDASFAHRLFTKMGPWIPASWRDGITIIAGTSSDI